jgi:hypothetical protein
VNKHRNILIQSNFSRPIQQSALPKHSPQSLISDILVRSRPQSAHLLDAISVTKTKIVESDYINFVKLGEFLFCSIHRVLVTLNSNLDSNSLTETLQMDSGLILFLHSLEIIYQPFCNPDQSCDWKAPYE